MFKNFLAEVSVLFSYPKDFVLLLSRIVLAYGFAKPSLLKFNDIAATGTWFYELSIPFARMFAYLVTSIELLGVVLLVLGLFTRFISILLSFIMLGAIVFVHAQHGYSIANNGIEIPLYYLVFLMIFATFGAGKYALDNLLFKDTSDE